MRFVGSEIRATDAIGAAELARLPVDVRDLVKRAAWRMNVEMGCVSEEPGTIVAHVSLAPNAAALELQRRALAARLR